MPSPSEMVSGMIERDTIRGVEFKTGIVVFAFYDDSAGFIADENLSKFRDMIKLKEGATYDTYPLDHLSDKSILLVSTNDDYGYSLFLMRQWLMDFNPKEIFIPDKAVPAFIKLGDGFNFIIAPFDLKDGIERGEGTVARLKSPQKSLSNFW